MEQYSLMDLFLSGVQWELTEYPAQNIPENILQKKSQNDDTSHVQIGIERSIVPSIQPMSVETAKSMAARPNNMDSLLRMLQEFNHPLKGCATNTVLPSLTSSTCSDLLIITDMPGAEDDVSGEILSGKAGELLDKMLMAINLSRNTSSIVPLLFWRTPGGRSPTREELDLAQPFVFRLIDFIKPKAILGLGALVAMELANVKITQEHEKIIMLKSSVPFVPIYHPNYLLLNQNAKRDAWESLKELQKLLLNGDK